MSSFVAIVERREVGKGFGGLSDIVRMEEDASSPHTMLNVTGDKESVGTFFLKT